MPDEEAFLDKPLNDERLLGIFQFPRKVLHGELRRVQGKIQGGLEKQGEFNRPAAIIDANSFAIDVQPVNYARARADLVCPRSPGSAGRMT